jgi:hypothetical protein
MRLMLHTLRKDLRHLWPVAAASWAMLAVIAHADCRRTDWVASPLEGWLTLVLSMAWACLVALAVLEEPLVGERNFWTTRPYRWPDLLGSKLLFAALLIHLPLFIADSAVLAVRGFNPLTYLGVLLAKQVLLFGALTLPAVALASLVRSFAQFVIAAFIVAAVIAIVNGGLDRFPELGRHGDAVRHAGVRIVLATAAIAAIAIQYARRRALPARAIAAIGTLAALAVATWTPALAEYGPLAGNSQAPPNIALRNGPPASREWAPRFSNWGETVFLPIEIAAGSEQFHIPLIEIEVTAPDGVRIRSTLPSPNHPLERIDLFARAWGPPGFPPNWLVLQFSKPAWDRVKDTRVDLRGSAGFEFYRTGPTTAIPIRGATATLELGRCSTSVVENPYSDEMLKVLCESPRPIPATKVVVHFGDAEEWLGGLNSARTFEVSPHETWFSPLDRADYLFDLTYGARTRRQVPFSSLSRVDVTPEIPTGTAIARFEWRGLSLAPWRIDRNDR